MKLGAPNISVLGAIGELSSETCQQNTLPSSSGGLQVNLDR